MKPALRAYKISAVLQERKGFTLDNPVYRTFPQQSPLISDTMRYVYTCSLKALLSEQFLSCY
jgi:hypothetical protein